MTLVLEELDPTTREYMLREFESEIASSTPYVPATLSETGIAAWPELARSAIREGDDATLLASLLADPTLFRSHEANLRKGATRPAVINHRQASDRLATSEFNTWYVRGLSARLLAEGVTEVEVYRAAPPKWKIASCAAHEGRIVQVQVVYDGHRSAYWPESNPTAFAIPFQAGCHHSIRRVREGADSR